MTARLGHPEAVAAVVTTALGKRYGSTWALRDCSVSVPTGAIAALVGPNGAGKTTFLRLVAGLSRATTGDVEVAGEAPSQTPGFLARVGFLAQDVPLYRRLNAEEHLSAGARMNLRWDDGAARARLEDLRIPLDRPVAQLSGGQRAQIGLAMALAKRPDLLLLDEPVAALDPLARRDFLRSLTAAVADGGLTVVLSSHLLRDLQEVCDHLVLLSGASPRLVGSTADLIAEHRVLVGPRAFSPDLTRHATVVAATHATRQSQLLVRLHGAAALEALRRGPHVVQPADLEEIVLAYMDPDSAPSSGSPLTSVGTGA